MFIKKLIIETPERTIRDISFKKGLNLIVDNTDIKFKTDTGNNVGKTTVLQLINFCLGADSETILKDSETKTILKDLNFFLTENKVIITLILSKDLKSDDVIIKRNFLKNSKKILEVNEEKFKNDKKFIDKLYEVILGEKTSEKPSFREIIAHNIRISDERISNTLKYLHSKTSDATYESLYLYMFGFGVADRSELLKKLNAEKNFKKRLLNDTSSTDLEVRLKTIQNKISSLNEEKEIFIINENYEQDLESINTYKLLINDISSEIGKLSLKKTLLLETEKELNSNYSDIDINSLKSIYKEYSKYNLSNLDKSFENLVTYHNDMIKEKIKFVTKSIPDLELTIDKLKEEKKIYISEMNLLNEKIKNSKSLNDLESIISELNENYQKMGELEKLLAQVQESENTIVSINDSIAKQESYIFLDDFKEKLSDTLSNFNSNYFSCVSKKLYNEEYNISFDIVKNKTSGKNVYKFKSYNDNNSSRKKQGEIICFDLAYILFARDYNIPHLDFILNDKKELLDGQKLLDASLFAEKNNIQIVCSILRDKLPTDLINSENIILELSQQDKLFRIENSKNN